MKTAAAFILLFTAMAPLCQAGPIATFTAGAWGVSGSPQTVGWEFYVNSAITVNQLFWYDPTGNLNKSFPVMMWNAADQSVVVPQTNVGFGSGSYNAATKYWGIAVSPVTLSAGSTYVIGGYTLSNDMVEAQITDLTTSPAITYQHNMIVTGGSIAYPSITQSQYGVAWIGANVGVVDTGVPEPGTWATLAAGLATLGAMLRRLRA
jgi:hypothetical protein